MGEDNFLQRIMNGRYDIRYDLDFCCRWEEYNKAIDYAKKYIKVKGMRETALELEQAGEKYKAEIAETVNPKRDVEESRYGLWKKWNSVKNICRSVTICLAVLTVLVFIINAAAPANIEILALLLLLFLLVSVPLLLVTKAGELICQMLYRRIIRPLQAQVQIIGGSYAERFRGFYKRMDNLYLNSLDLAQREMVLMRREQAEHMKKMERMEEERRRLENERLHEQRKATKAQERLLEIEEEKERRRNSWY